MTGALHDARKRRLLETLAGEGWDAAIVYGNAWQCDYLRYATDFPIIEGDALAVIMADGETRLFVESPAEAERATVECPDIAVEWTDDVVGAAKAHLARLGNRAIGSAPASLMPYGLRGGADQRPIADATAAIDRLLMAKTPEEIDAVRRAAALAHRGYEAFMEATRVGRAEYEITADVEAYFRSVGCPENFMILGSGGREVRGMHPPGERRIRHGDLVTTELTPSVEGYYAQVCRTLVVGAPTDEQIAAYDIYIEAAAAGEAILRAGVTAAEIARAENDVFRRHGLGEYTTSEYTRVRGHGLGLFVDTKPHILEDVDTVLPEGATLTVHPNTYNPVVGYMVLGDTAVVTAKGCEIFSTETRRLLTVPG